VSPGTRLAAIALIVLMAIGSVVLWLGIPVLWLWVASQMTDSTQPQMGPYALVIVGIPLSMFLFGRLLRGLNGLYGEITRTTPEVRVQLQWLKSMRAERDELRPRTILDVVMVLSVAVALVAFSIWFFFFAGSSLPS
jgi:hypothetical protein